MRAQSQTQKSERNNVMGMAASQARFLGLTARKTNLEYEGQQINQQRTSLANQSAAYYNDLLTMAVPTVPSAIDYTTTVYSFTDGAIANQLTSMIARTDGSYTVSYLQTYTNDNAIVSTNPSRIIRDVDAVGQPTGRYKVGGEFLKGLDTWEGITFTINGGVTPLYLHQGKYYTDSGYTNEYTGEPNDITVNVSNDYPANGYYNSLTASQFMGVSARENDYLTELQNAGFSSPDWVLKYVLNSSTNAYVPVFYDKSVLDGAQYDDNQHSISLINAYTYGSATVTEEVTGATAFLEQDASGRYVSITLEDASGNRLTYSLSTNTITDNDAYNDAMNQYEYNKAMYDKNIQEVNAKIEIVQSEDKSLELRLKQLDTEEKAIQTEIDAVSSVIKNNVEKSFKTFG